jgi:putative aldouronate transport system permease protein
MRKHELNAVSNTGNVFLTALFVIVAIVCILPIWLIIAISFASENSIIENGYRFIPPSLSFAAYKFLWSVPQLVINSYLITIVVTLVGTILNVLINSLYAYTLSRKDFPYRNFFSIIVLITLLFSGGLAPFYYVYARLLDVKNTLYALILPGLGLGFMVFIVRTFFSQNVPVEVLDSSKIDGAGEFRTFFQIVMPMVLPILATVALFTAISYWNDFFNCMLFIEKSKFYNLQYTMQKSLMQLDYIKSNLSKVGGAGVYLSELLKNIPTQGVRMAMVVVGIGPIVLAYPFLQRYFIKGLTIGAVKG